MVRFQFRKEDPYLAAARKRIAATPARDMFRESYFLYIKDSEAPVTHLIPKGKSLASEALRHKESERK